MIKKKRLPNENDWKQVKKLEFFIVLFLVILVSIHDKNITWEDGRKFSVWSGFYFKMITYSEVDSLVLEDKIPNLKLRSNGYAAFGKKKGNFIRSNDAKEILLFVNKPRSKCIHLFLEDGGEVYFNFDKDEKTVELFNELKIRLKD